MMFKPSPILQKRTPVRLKGFRRPALRLLRAAEVSMHPLATMEDLGVPHIQPTRGQSNHDAWKKLGHPIVAIQRRAGLTVVHQGAGSGDPAENTQLARLGATERIWSPREQQLREEGKADLVDVPAIARKKQKRRTGHEIVPLENATQRPRPRTNPGRYKPPATLYWQHSIYTYNKASMKPLPATTRNATKMLRGFITRYPKDLDGVLDALRTENSRARTPLRAYLSDRSSPRTDMLPSLIGVISMLGKGGFLYPWRAMQSLAPEITFKHYNGGRVGIQTFVYDRRIEALRQERQRVWGQMKEMMEKGGLMNQGKDGEVMKELEGRLKAAGVQ
ncbi:hypothetical protein P152DRAFT_455212 [Eremomyces bilateralis CBS 781.70]|uniref:Uncharacterized protein n=1 Tax=Eremomyces bilateralis CBS 781.70 TaxID=1392243 RepID=A0A6G1GBR3_9PEZI|nr:uncharacterized protein P152DRAFT_455212 [Eremomyces bilateralis CBS 781.70]KAF1815493.1 hypothetical protein P152DRAFT_455212 [Eremomyces bilateralis CBS 781.70]